jgi:hypothetical protein
VRAVPVGVSGLEPGTTYHYRIVASNSWGTTDGEDVTFTTKGAHAADRGIGVELTDDADDSGDRGLGQSERPADQLRPGSRY